VTLPVIPEDQRRTEKELCADFEKQRPAILGALLDAVSCALRNLNAVRFTKLPRMADSAVWVVAAEPKCPWPEGTFIAALEDQRRDADELVIESSLLAKAVTDYIERHGDLEGTATQILERLSAGREEKVLKDAAWPKAPSALGARLREVAPNLRRLGLEVQFGRDGQKRTIAIRKNRIPPETPSLPSLPSPPHENADPEATDDDSGDARW
jgi:hypothetical protein